MNQRAFYTGLLLLSSTALGACALLFSDAASNAAQDGGPKPGPEGGAVVDAGVQVELCSGDAGVLCGAVENRGFSVANVNNPFDVTNVALEFRSVESKLYAAVQGNAGTGSTTRWDSWGRDAAPQSGSKFPEANQVCIASDKSCLGPLHLRDSTKLCLAHRSSLTSTSGVGHDCKNGVVAKTLDGGFISSCIDDVPGTEDAYSVHGADRFSAYLVGDTLRTSNTVNGMTVAEVKVTGEFGIWGGVLLGISSELRAIYIKNNRLLLIGFSGVAEDVGDAVRYPDVALVGNDVIVAGVASDRINASTYELASRQWPRPATKPDDTKVDMAGLKLQAPSPPKVKMRPFKPILVRSAGDKLRLVALSVDASGDASAGAPNCKLHAFVERDRKAGSWSQYPLLDTPVPCSAISFDAALDSDGKLHVLYGAGTADLGYKVLPAPAR